MSGNRKGKGNSASAYAKAGVDYEEIEPFKEIMQEMGKQTLKFPNKRKVFVKQFPHGAAWMYMDRLLHSWSGVQEGLGNKNWIAEWMYQSTGTGETYYREIGIDAALMAVNDVIAQGAMPVVYCDEVAAGDSKWFADEIRSKDLARGYYDICEEVGMALPAGESPSLRYLVNAELPVKSAPSLSGSVVGIIVPATQAITGVRLQPGDHIIGVTSSGVHANGISLVIDRVMKLRKKFLYILSSGRTIGEEILTPTRSYVKLVEMLIEEKVKIHALLPGTGSGVSKIAFDKRSFTYRIHSWIEKEEMPLILQFIREELGISKRDYLTTFNNGMGYYIFVPTNEVEHTISIGEKAGYQLFDIGVVESGKRGVIFKPENIILPPPGE